VASMVWCCKVVTYVVRSVMLYTHMHMINREELADAFREAGKVRERSGEEKGTLKL